MKAQLREPSATARRGYWPRTASMMQRATQLAWFGERLLLWIVFVIGSVRPAPSQLGPTNPAKGQKTSPAYDAAFKLLESGKVTAAWDQLNQAISRNPRDPMLQNLRGLVALRLGRPGDAEASFRKVVELAPQAAMGYTNLATLLAEQGRRREAVELFQAALRRAPSDFSALLGLGSTLASLRKFDRAAPFLEKAWKVRPDDFQAGYEYAQTLGELKRPSDAQKVLGRLRAPSDTRLAAKYYALLAVLAEDLGDARTAARRYEQAYSLTPDSFDLYFSLVRARLAANAAKTGGALPAPPAQLSAEQHFALGVLFASQGSYAEAIPHFDETLRLQPSSSSAAFNLALCYKEVGRPQDGIRLLEREIESKPSAELHDLLASLYEADGRYLDAVRHFQQAVELDPSSEQYYFDLGAEYLVHFTFGPATEVFRAGTRKFPASGRQHIGLGMAHYALRHYREAAEEFLTALENDPASPAAFAAWNSLPAFLAPAESEEILPRLRRLAELHPASAVALYCYGAGLVRQGLALAKPEMFVRAQPALERAAQLKPDFAEAHIELGNLFAAQKQSEKSVLEYLAAIRLNPDSELAHYRLGQAYRDLNRLEVAEQELARYAELSRTRHERMARSRKAIQQFILAQPGSRTASAGAKVLP